MPQLIGRRGERFAASTRPDEALEPDFARFPGDGIRADFVGSPGDDVFAGGNDNDTATGNGGNDTLSGNGGNDLLVGNAGADTLDGGDADDTLYSHDRNPNLGTATSLDIFAEVDTLTGGSGDDRIFAGYGDNANGGTPGTFGDTLYISFLGAPSGVQADFRLMQFNGSLLIGGGTIRNFQAVGYLEGSNFDDVLVPIDTNYPAGAAVYGRGGNDHIIATYYSGWASGWLYGGDGDDLIDARPAQYSPNSYGEAGNDRIHGGSGYERLEGGEGNDIVDGNSGFDSLFGGAGNDVMDGGSYDDSLFGEAGDDTLYGAGDTDGIQGGEGNDLIYGDYSLISSSNSLSSNSNNDQLAGGAGADIIYGDWGDDRLWSAESTTGNADDTGLEHDQLFGGAGNDTLSIGYGDDADGGTETDVLRMSLIGPGEGVMFSTAGFTPGGLWTVNGGTIQNIETIARILGSSFGDSITIATHGFVVTVDAAGGNDVITSSGSAVIGNGGDGNDRFISGEAGDTFDGGAGTDIIDGRNATAGITVTLGLNAGEIGYGPGGDQLRNIEDIDGSAYEDTLSGSNGDNYLQGMAGNDVLNGNGGNDTLDGREGIDLLSGGEGGDFFFARSDGDTHDGGTGIDTIDYRNSATGVTVTLALQAGQTGSGPGGDQIVNVENVNGTAYVDTLNGSNDSNFLQGNGGNDVLNGHGGNDQLSGGFGDDVMTGGAGDDDFLVHDSGDQVFESADQGFDEVLASASFVLAAGQHVERLALFGDPLAALSLTGNEFANHIIGNDGANALNGGGGNDVIEGGGGIDTMSGGTGDDSYYVDAAGDIVAEAVGAGFDTVYTSLSWALAGGVEVEMLAAAVPNLAVALNLTGNEFGQTLQGNAGVNLLNGGGGADVLIGLGGNDTYLVDAGDQVTELIGGGTDYVAAATDYALNAGAWVELISTTNNGGTAALNLTGNEISQTLVGNEGANRLDGGGGPDLLVGFGGNDTYIVDGDDRVAEAAGGGSDYIAARSSFTLDPGAEVELISTTDNGGTAAINLIGSAYAQVLVGNAGANFLNGGGGADTLVGLGGNDTYIVDSDDQVVEAAAGGSDYIAVAGSFVLTADADVELISTTNNDGTAAINLTGNALAQTLIGNAGANFLNGGGGADLLVGLRGNDTYLVDSDDRVIEADFGGADYVAARSSFVLEAGASVELISTTDNGGSAAINLAGNEFNQTLVGNAGANVLRGGGGGDVLVGLGGNDIYYLDANDLVHEAAGGGYDYVLSSSSFFLNTGSEVELLSTTDNGGTEAYTLHGNDLGQSVVGNAGANILDGKGGTDVLVGLGGADGFTFTTVLGAGNVATIVDFSAADDTIRLDDAVFTTLAPGGLNPNALVIGTAAADADDRIVYDQATGQLFYDADGNGAGAAILFATLSGAPVITAADFMVF